MTSFPIYFMKMEDLTDRLKKIRITLNLSQREFSKRMFISQSLYSDIESGKIELKERYIRLISSQFHVNIEWIKTGNGEIFSGSPSDIRFKYLKDIFGQLSPELQDCVLDHLKGLLKVQKKTKK